MSHAQHFREHDEGTPLSNVEQIKAVYPGALVQVYVADHGFNWAHRTSCDEASVQSARRRTIEFFPAALG